MGVNLYAALPTLTAGFLSHVEAAGTLDEARQKLADRGLFVYSVKSRNSLVSGFFGFS